MRNYPYTIKILNRLIKNLLQCDTWIIKGAEKTSGSDLTILYAGDKIHKNYIVNRVFAAKKSQTLFKSLSIKNIYSMVKNNPYECSVMFIQGRLLHRFLYQSKIDFSIPTWVTGEFSLSNGYPPKSAKREITRIRKNKFEYKIVNNKNEMDKFYYEMYLPYIIKRHENRAFIINYDSMMKTLNDKRNELLQVKRNGETIAAGQILYENRQPRIWNCGIKDGDYQHVKNGAIAAIYYFSGLYLRTLGYDSVCAGNSRAFLTDGVLQYKKKWGLSLIEHQGLRKIQNTILGSGIIVKPLLLCEGTKAFFLANPFIIDRKGSMNVAVFVETSSSLSPKARKALFKRNNINGVCKLCVYNVDNLLF